MIEENEVPPDLIHLQNAHVTQLAQDGVKGDWFVRKNITNEDLHTFPPLIADDLMFNILNFARKFELTAFNEGIKFQKNKQNKYLMAQLEESKLLNIAIKEENERLANILEQHIGE